MLNSLNCSPSARRLLLLALLGLSLLAFSLAGAQDAAGEITKLGDKANGDLSSYSKVVIPLIATVVTLGLLAFIVHWLLSIVSNRD